MPRDSTYRFEWPSVSESLLDEPGVVDAIRHLHRGWVKVRALLNPRDLSLEKDVLSQFVRKVMGSDTSDLTADKPIKTTHFQGKRSAKKHSSPKRTANASLFGESIQVVNKPGVDEAVCLLTDHWEHARQLLHRPNHHLGAQVLARFAREALGYPTHVPDEITGVWAEARPGTLRAGDVIRVKDNAFPNEHGLGERHNSRVCEVLWVEGGEVIVQSCDGRHPYLEGTRYSPHDLEYLDPSD